LAQELPGASGEFGLVGRACWSPLCVGTISAPLRMARFTGRAGRAARGRFPCPGAVQAARRARGPAARGECPAHFDESNSGRPITGGVNGACAGRSSRHPGRLAGRSGGAPRGWTRGPFLGRPAHRRWAVAARTGRLVKGGDLDDVPPPPRQVILLDLTPPPDARAVSGGGTAAVRYSRAPRVNQYGPGLCSSFELEPWPAPTVARGTTPTCRRRRGNVPPRRTLGEDRPPAEGEVRRAGHPGRPYVPQRVQGVRGRPLPPHPTASTCCGRKLAMWAETGRPKDMDQRARGPGGAVSAPAPRT